MKHFYKWLTINVFILLSITTFAQDFNLDSLQTAREEFYFELSFDSPKQLQALNQMVSIDKVEGNNCIAYANPEQFVKLLQAGYKPHLLLPPSFIYPNQPMSDVEDLRQTNEWDTYPTYEAYVAMMQAFQTNYPNLCTIVNFGTLSSGRQMLAARINNGNPAGKPEFLYTSTMHGDETTGYVLMLRLINYLLTNYGTDPSVAQLVDNMDIWINPLANPDGTYWGGNSTVNGSRRGNANNIDLNRNYPDPEDGPHPDGNAYQQETVKFMELAESRNFVMAANFHGGAEVLNYPWDTWVRRHADDAWWIFVSREYADTAHVYSPNGYLTDLNNGITNGYDWYTTAGCRQDYMNYFRNCREETIELSNTKLLPAAQLPAHWNYNYRSLLNYMKQALNGFHGVVTDSISGVPIVAKVEIVGHDIDNAFVFSSLDAGDYHRPVKAGTYNLTFSAEGYYPKTIYGLTIADRQQVELDVEMAPGAIIADFTASTYEIAKGGQINYFDATYGSNIVSWQWEFEGGVPATSSLTNPTGITYSTAGVYDVKLTVTNGNGQTSEILKQDLITVTSMYIMTNGTFTTCEGTFYDSGGTSAAYGNSEDIITTFIPDTDEALMKVQFTMFDIEAQTNCTYDYLKIYDGLNTSAPLLGTWCGTNSPGTIIANNAGKGLTFQFHSDNSVTKPGWSAIISCFSTVSINETDANKFVIFPNPTQQDIVTIRAVSPITQIRVFDVSGKMQFETVVSESIEYQFSTSKLNSGIYFIEVETNESRSIQKLIKY